MRRTSVSELHRHTSELVREASEGQVIVIERRGEPVAELCPITPTPRLSAEKKAQIFASMQDIWGKMPLSSIDSTKLIEEDRDR